MVLCNADRKLEGLEAWLSDRQGISTKSDTFKLEATFLVRTGRKFLASCLASKFYVRPEHQLSGRVFYGASQRSRALSKRKGCQKGATNDDDD